MRLVMSYPEGSSTEQACCWLAGSLALLEHSGSLRQHPVSPVDFDPFRNSIIPTSTIPQGQSSIIDLPSSGKRPANQLLCPRAKRPALFQHDNAQGILHQAIELLRLEHGERVAASNAFPPEIPPSRIRESLASYEEEIAAASKTSACCSCGRLVCVTDIYQVGNRDSLLRPLEGSLDHCGRHGDQWDLCSSCHAALMRGTIPKFSATNLANVTLCQHYPDELEDLTLSGEYLIAKCHPLGVVVRLRPGGRSSPVNYHALRGHFIVIPQDPGPLLQILPSPELRLHTLIKVFWLGNRPPTGYIFKPVLACSKATGSGCFALPCLP
ncbi:unnamed protein product [Penicillium nalgiovense]|nr:unnamed protein product [Penicillium nalgiovense]